MENSQERIRPIVYGSTETVFCTQVTILNMARTTTEFRAFRDSLLGCIARTGLASCGKNRNEFSAVVYGVSHRQDILRRFWADEISNPELSIIRDIGNRFSKFAIAVNSEYGQIGFFPDGVAEILAPHLDAGRLQLEVVYTEIQEFNRKGEEFIGMRIEVRLQPWADDLISDTFSIS